MEIVLALAHELADPSRNHPLARLIGLLAICIPLAFYVGYRLLGNERERRRDARTAADWSTASGTVLVAKPVWARPPHAVPELAGREPQPKLDRVGVRYVFEVDGQEYEGNTPNPDELTRRRWGAHRAWKYAQRHPPGSEVAVRYDPEDPTRNCADPAATASGQTQE
ncbi:DUF3592 domain-containing protein [Nocardiopsis nanhaiensis]